MNYQSTAVLLPAYEYNNICITSTEGLSEKTKQAAEACDF